MDKEIVRQYYKKNYDDAEHIPQINDKLYEQCNAEFGEVENALLSECGGENSIAWKLYRKLRKMEFYIDKLENQYFYLAGVTDRPVIESIASHPPIQGTEN